MQILTNTSPFELDRADIDPDLTVGDLADLASDNTTAVLTLKVDGHVMRRNAPALATLHDNAVLELVDVTEHTWPDGEATDTEDTEDTDTDE